MHKFCASWIALAAMAASAPTQAQGTDVSYDFFDARYVSVDANGLDGDGINVEASYNVSGNWLIVGALAVVGFDFNVDSTAISVGGGYFWPMSGNVDVFTTASFVSASVDTDFGDADETGFQVTGGVRSRFTDKLEGRAELRYADVGDGDTLVRLTGDYYVQDNVMVGLAFDLGGDADAFYVGGRWAF